MEKTTVRANSDNDLKYRLSMEMKEEEEKKKIKDNSITESKNNKQTELEYFTE